jgi:hypothetical protein
MFIYSLIYHLLQTYTGLKEAASTLKTSFQVKSTSVFGMTVGREIKKNIHEGKYTYINAQCKSATSGSQVTIFCVLQHIKQS